MKIHLTPQEEKWANHLHRIASDTGVSFGTVIDCLMAAKRTSERWGQPFDITQVPADMLLAEVIRRMPEYEELRRLDMERMNA